MVIRPLLNSIVCVGMNILCYLALNLQEKINVLSFLGIQAIVVFFIFICDRVAWEMDKRDT